MGGVFRWLSQQFKFGIHRFSFATRQEREVDVAQIASASIIGYLREMDVDVDLFRLSTAAGPQEIYQPTREALEKMAIINNGFGKAIWQSKGRTA